MTSLPAETFNLKQRGKIAKGYYADLAVIDLRKFRDNATFTDPHLYAEGVVHLFVNGVQAMENGEPTGRRGGRGLRMT
jgi:N-acyl-D-aspartate/D-glutamate deacylase